MTWRDIPALTLAAIIGLAAGFVICDLIGWQANAGLVIGFFAGAMVYNED